MTWFLIILGMLIWWLRGQGNRKRLRQIAKELPTNIPEWPLVGHTYLYFGTDEDRMKALQKFGLDAIKQGGIIGTWHATELYVCVTDPEIAEILLKSCLAKDENLIRFIRVISGNGSLFAPVNIWRPRRKMMLPMFSPKRLNGFVEIFATQSATMVELLRPKAGTGDFSIWKYITTYTFDSVSESNMGVKMNSQQEDHQFLEAFSKATAFVAARVCQPWLYSDFIYRLLPSYWELRRCTKYLDEFVDDIIRDKRKGLNANGYNKNLNINEIEPDTQTFLEMIIELAKDKGYNDVDLREEMKVILMAGTDTSAVGASFTILLLSRHPDIQEAVYKELYEVFGNSKRKVEVEDLPKLKYLEAVIKESLRLYPPVPIIVREVHDDVALPTGTTLVKGIRIYVNIWGTHRNPRYWGDDVDQFRPDRFLEGPLKHPAQFIPFSYGIRNCIGYQYAMMSTKTLIATLLRSYRALPPVGLDPAQYREPLRVQYDIMMKHVDNFVLRLEKRN